MAPGFDDVQLRRLMQQAIERCQLDLSGAVVFTEAASAAYRATPILAAMAGAKSAIAIARETRYGTVEQIAADLRRLAKLVGVEEKIEIIGENRKSRVADADVVTNCGHVRPIDAEIIGRMKPSAVVPLMYEAWELRPADIDLAACRRRGIAVAGTNERHPRIAVFQYLAPLAMKLLFDAGLPVRGSRVLLACDNPFQPYLADGLARTGAMVDTCRTLGEPDHRAAYDIVLVALLPQAKPSIGPDEAALIARHWPDAIVAQFWGDIDRTALTAENVPFWPIENPGAGHMGILLSAIGPEPIVRLQAGGLKVAEVLRKPIERRTPDDLAYLDELRE